MRKIASDLKHPEPSDARGPGLGLLCQKLVHDPSVYAAFIADPVPIMRSFGITMDGDFEMRAEGKSLASFLKNGGDPLSRVPPGELNVPKALVRQQSQEPPWIVPVAIVAVAIASTPAVFTSDAASPTGASSVDDPEEDANG